MLLTLILIPLLAASTLTFLARYKKHRKKGIQRRNRETWAIGLYKGPSPVTLYPHESISNPILTAKDVTDITARFVADPFMIQNTNGYYLFFEVLNDKRNTGEIGYAFSPDAILWNYQNIILKERYHLSYPYVFSAENCYYMIPECNGSKGIQLYEAIRFPNEWKHIATLIKDNGRHAALVDPSIVHYNNHWYLFCYAGKLKNLHLFTSTNLTGPWHEHPKSPVVQSSPQFARPAGKVIITNGILYRYAQDETPNYGTRVWAFRITELTPQTYLEEPASTDPVIQPGTAWWNKDGMHTIDLHQTNTDEYYAFVDGFTINAQL